MYIVFAILLFGFLIAIHEFGHLIAAKAFHVKVNEYAIGMGPALFKKQGKETLYSIRAIPIGGYCAMEGEDEAEEASNPRALNNQPFWKKLIIYVAGPLMNLVIAFVILFFLYVGAYAFYTTELAYIAPEVDLPSKEYLMVGDAIYSIDGERTYITNDVSTLLSRGDEIHDIVIIRNGERIELKDFRLPYQDCTSMDGKTYRGFGFSFGYKEATFWDKIKIACMTTVDYMRLVRISLEDLISGAASMQDLSGPVGIVDTIQDIGSQSESFAAAIENILNIGALISVNLGLLNLLPIPALDGGKVFFLLINGIVYLFFKKEIPLKYETYINLAGFVLLIGLSIFVMYNDIIRIIH